MPSVQCCVGPMWQPHVVTAADGRATVSVEMPGNLTQWRFSVLAITTDTQVGEATATLTTALPLTARAVAPRFFIAGDVLPLAAIIQNNTDEPLQVEVRMEQRGLRLREANATQSIPVAARGLVRVEWWGTVDPAADGVYMAVYAVADNGLSDASIPTLTTGKDNTIPVYAFNTVDTLTFSGALSDADTRAEALEVQIPVPPIEALKQQLPDCLV